MNRDFSIIPCSPLNRKATSLPSLRRFATNMPLGPELVHFLSSHQTLQTFIFHHRIGAREIEFYSNTFADLAESRAAHDLPPLSIFSNHSERDYGYCNGACSRGRNVLFAFPYVSEKLSLVQTVSCGVSSIRPALAMGPMDLVAVYLDVDFTISVKDVVALLHPLRLAFDAVRDFVLYVPRGPDIVLTVSSLERIHSPLDVLIFPSPRDNRYPAGRVMSFPRIIIPVSRRIKEIFILQFFQFRCVPLFSPLDIEN